MGIVEKAKAENKVIHAYYHDVWFTPEELEKKQRQGKFCWGDGNFRLHSREKVKDWAKDDIKKVIKHFSPVLDKRDFAEITSKAIEEAMAEKEGIL